MGLCYSAELIRVIKREHQLEKTSSYNKDQVQKIIELLEQIDRALNQRKIRKTIGIITPYNAQKRRLRSEVEKCGFKNFDEIKIDTVDAFQGEEADIIIYSTVKTCGNLSFLLDSKRLNVAFLGQKKISFLWVKSLSLRICEAIRTISLALFCKSADRQFISKDNHQTFRFKTLS